jgi:hypothetical protein
VNRPVEPVRPEPAVTEVKPDPVVKPPESGAGQPGVVDMKLLLVAMVVALLILAVSAAVLRYVLEITNIGALVVILVILLPFVLVVAGRLTGQDFIGWLGSLLRRK